MYLNLIRIVSWVKDLSYQVIIINRAALYILCMYGESY